MIFIFGGAYQGKREYCKKITNLSDGEIYDCPPDGVHLPEGARAICRLEKLILARINAGLEVRQYISDFFEKWDGLCVICEDICCGVVPVSATHRSWRDSVGICASLLAAKAHGVYRMFCSIPMRLK